MTVKIIIAGAPASGKGTQCEFIKEAYGVVHLSTGDMLRAAAAEGTEIGIKVRLIGLFALPVWICRIYRRKRAHF